MKLFNKLFLSGYYFTIALRHNTGRNIIQDCKFVSEFTLKANRQKWAADPVLVDYGSKTYLFYEAVEKDKGYIAVCEVYDDCSLSSPVPILRDEHHYSYPLVFSANGSWYMIPESSSAEEVRLYKAVKFPYEWEKVTVLLRGRYVDTTVFSDGTMHYFLTFESTGATECVIPKVFVFSLCDLTKGVRQLNWPEFDELKVRGAGPIMVREGALIRPAQISTKYRYGDAIAFYAVDDYLPVYREHMVSKLQSGDVKTNKYYVDGLHTYSSSQKFEAIDIRCRDFDFWKTPKKIYYWLKNKCK